MRVSGKAGLIEARAWRVKLRPRLPRRSHSEGGSACSTAELSPSDIPAFSIFQRSAIMLSLYDSSVKHYGGFYHLIATATIRSRDFRRGRGRVPEHFCRAWSVPTGLCQPAQGCEERATLGKGRKQSSTATRLWQFHFGTRNSSRNRVAVGDVCSTMTQGSRSPPPPGSGAASRGNLGLWDGIPLEISAKVLNGGFGDSSKNHAIQA